MVDIKFFVAVPVYKTEKYIRRCIDSVLAQTYQNFNIVLVDDGSPDKAGIICDQYAKADSRIIVIHQKNQGLLSARRAAVGYILSHAVSDGYVMFLDSDDSLKSNALEVVSKTILETRAELVMFRWERVDEEGKLLSSHKPQKEAFEGIIADKGQLYKRVFSDTQYNSLCLKALPVSLLDNDNYQEMYGIAHAEDLLQSIPFYKRCNYAVFIKNQLYNYTSNPDSITHDSSVKNYDINSTVRYTVLKFLQNENVWSDKDMKEYLSFCGRLVSGTISEIANLNASFGEKESLYKKMLQDEYYRYVISSNPNNRLLQMLNKEQFRSILFRGQIYSYCKKLYHAVLKKK